MNKIIRYWNENRGKIILVIIIIASLVLIIQLLNYFAKTQITKESKKNTIKEDLSQLPTQSIITGESVDKETTKENMGLVEQFIKFCNESNTTEAYNMLTEECKKALFTTEEEFIQNYYNLIFTEKKLYGINNFRNNSHYYTYEVKFYQDALSTGKIEDNDVYQDYITIDEKQNKISINSFIYQQEINKTIEENNIQITVLSKEVYKDYEQYHIVVKNNTEKNILLDSRESSKNVYAIGSDYGKYQSYIYEIAGKLLEIGVGNSRTYKLKINKIYNPSVTIKSICFSDIVMDQEAYEKKEETERISISINI